MCYNDCIQYSFRLLQCCIISNNLVSLKSSRNKTSIWVLDLGCGDSASFFTLQRYFSNHGIQINYAGVDIQGNKIDENTETCSKHLNANFYEANASHPKNLEDFFSAHFADLVVCQHPQVLGYGNEAVRSMLTNTLPHYLARDGRVYISCFESKEWEVVRNLKLNECPVLPQDEKECWAIQQNSPGNTDFVYASLVPLKFNELFPEAKSEKSPLVSEEKPETSSLSKCGMFKKTISQGLTRMADFCCRKSNSKKS